MRRTWLRQVLIDCHPDDFDANVAFWSEALGARPVANPDDPEYVELADVPGEITLLLQCVDAPSRVHLDIESDDVEAEARRLEALGAIHVRKVKTWWVMRDPAGLLFGVI